MRTTSCVNTQCHVRFWSDTKSLLPAMKQITLYKATRSHIISGVCSRHCSADQGKDQMGGQMEPISCDEDVCGALDAYTKASNAIDAMAAALSAAPAVNKRCSLAAAEQARDLLGECWCHGHAEKLCWRRARCACPRTLATSAEWASHWCSCTALDASQPSTVWRRMCMLLTSGRWQAQPSACAAITTDDS